ncbi:TPA: helix-turn-helix domain-containing protein [Clostridium perfringens]|uniref:helix-turn-helix domain-containing protein n=1 Tax=Clostridium perfringens TaxID=1502 RepID=UPI001A2A0E2E|nr:helix-turn-helix domain-containing protein [Clostridium perfringens]ELU5588197.1 helix-turn-helix domain-containing protein [Clostridium perfringens]MDU3845740.1 helix-turn-helix domain-containing protein [Clostridium perfringens]HAT4252768.1 helix-turn-helix domain-containing protein [Clostridium perfringens]HAT4270476.1 helix-turn-helix domain-containing protein [Clostridium perfringens]
MFKEDLLETSEKIQYNIFKKVYVNNGKISKNNLCNELNISLPTLKNHLKKIEDLLDKCYKSKVKISYSKDFIFLKYNTGISLHCLTTCYIESSLKYKLLKFFFIKHTKKFTGIQICNYFNISLATLNRKILECNSLLKEFDISIKNYELTGSQLQISYFYYLLFWNNRIDISSVVSANHNITEVIEKTFNITLKISEKYPLYTWLKILMIRKKFFVEDFFKDEFTKKNLRILENTEIFIELKNFFEKDSLSKSSSTYLAYSTLCFILSFNIIPYKVIKKISIVNESTPFKIFTLMTSEMSNLYTTSPSNFNDELKLHLLSLCFKSYFFKGVFYSNNKIVTNYYLNEFTSDSREKFVNNLLLKINSLYKVKYSFDPDYFKLCIILTLNYLSGVSKHSLTIGILSRIDSLILNTTIDYLRKFLRRKFDVIVEVYNEYKKENYDLVITNFDPNYIPKNYNNIYIFSNLAIQYDLNNIVKMLNEIEKTKFEG